jgi:hypothetical protein
MDKIAYFKRGQELGLPARCPLVGYCNRWVWSVYFNSYDREEFNEKETVSEFLKRQNELPSDFDSKKVKLFGEPVISQRSHESLYGQNFCPEIALFSEHRPLILPKEALSSYSWSKQEGVSFVEHTHFSECLEFVQAKYFQQSDTTQFKKASLEISSNPLEVAKQELIEFRDLVERQTWKDILIDGKPQENIARALLQTFLANRSYREVPVRGGRVDILSFQKEGRILYEAKIWRGEKYHAQGLREISEYLKGEGEDDDLFAVFYVVFDSTKTYCSKSHLGESFTVERIGIHDVYTITICLAPPQPSTIKPSS